jgi:hypothetical protein
VKTITTTIMMIMIMICCCSSSNYEGDTLHHSFLLTTFISRCPLP